MSLPSVSLKRPVLAVVMSLLIIVFGGIGYTYLGVREYPAIDPPMITISTAYTGANPDIVESQITEPLEKSINGIPGIRNISSTSSLGSSQITVEFNLDIDLEQAANDVRDKVSQAQRLLPQDIDAPPVVFKADANSDPIMFIPVQSTSKNVNELSDYVENVLMERLQTVPGVSQVGMFGLKRYAMRLWINPVKLAAYRLTIQDVQAALSRENVELPGGKVYGNETELTVKSYGRLTTEDEFNNLIIQQTANQVIRFKDIGTAELGSENEETGAKRNNVTNISMVVIPQPGANYIEIASEVRKRIIEIRKELPPDMILDLGIDKSQFVEKAIEEVEETLLISFVLVVIVIYLFFRDWLIALRPLIDIPVALIGTFFIMYIFGFSINVLTLLGIVLATGLVVDDGIVVTENIFKKLEQGKNRYQAAKEGSEEIFFAVISTSITLAVVFLPIIFLQGFVGSLFREFGIVVAGAVLISAFVSLSLTPVLSVRLASDHTNPGWFYRKTEPFFQWLDQSYRSSLAKFMHVRWWAFVIIAACFAVIYLVGTNLQSELAPLEDRSLTRISVTLPEGSSYESTERFITDLTQFVIDSVAEQRMVFGITAPNRGSSSPVNTGFVSVLLKDPKDRGENGRSQQEIVDYLNKNLRRFNQARAFPTQEQTIQIGFGGTALPVQFVIQNLNFEKLKDRLPKFMEEVQKDPTFQISDINLKFNRPELYITINRLKATELGVSVLDVSNTLQLALSNRRFGYFLMNGKQYQVIGQVERADRDAPLDLKSFYVRSNKGELIQLDNLVTMEETSNPPQIFHFNRFKSATVSASLAPGKTLGDGIKAMQAIADRVLDDSFSTDLSGPSRDFAESSSNTSFALILALGLIYLILAAQFESFTDPFIIMVTVPLAFAGALLSLWIFNQTLNIFSQIGIIMLIGLVTKNGILIVEFANEKRKEGLSKIDAAVEAAALRLRPILMTSLVTAFGALPIALSLGSASKSRIPLGIVIVGGLMFSLILTLYVIPAVYSYFSRRRTTHPELEEAESQIVPAE
jgi:multidrug efflux pump